MKQNPKAVQVKICGLTDIRQALACAEMGADAIGLVFFSGSPRCVSHETARAISTALPKPVKSIGVFVNDPFATIVSTARNCRLDAVQLHGQESPSLVEKLQKQGLMVIKALFSAKEPDLAHAPRYRATAYLVESGGGSLPGGNAETWDWQQAASLAEHYPVLLAGGLSPQNVKLALAYCRPAGIDLSSGVETVPGQKNLALVAALFEALAEIPPSETSPYTLFT